MIIARKSISLDEKIEKAEAAVIAAKAKYDKAIDELKVLVEKRRQLDDKKVLEAYHSSDRSLEEILKFLQKEDEED